MTSMTRSSRSSAPRTSTQARLSNPVQMLLVAVAELPLAQRAPFPGLEAAGDEREEAQGVVGRHDRYANHVAEREEHEERFHGGADLERLLRVLVAEHPVEELPERFRPAAMRFRHQSDASTFETLCYRIRPARRSPGGPPVHPTHVPGRVRHGVVRG